jgi:hypothetical protein
MVGVVTTRHLFTQSRLIVREFGTRCFLRCVWRTLTARHDVTFLECIERTTRGARSGGPRS